MYWLTHSTLHNRFQPRASKWCAPGCRINAINSSLKATQTCTKRKGKKGNGKGMCSFFSSSRKFWGPFFPLFSPNREKRVKIGAKGRRKTWKILKEAVGPFLAFQYPRIWRNSFFMTFSNPFMPLLKTICTLFRTRLCSFLNPFLPPFFSCSRCFLYYSPIISRYVPLLAPPLDHVRAPLLRGPVGGLYLSARD